jgi:hypothetical protein
MKTVYLFIFTCFVSLVANAQKQDSIPVTSIIKVNLTEKIALDTVLEIEFVKVISDSRCPKNVQCIWAGEAVILVKLYRNGQFEKEEQLTIHPKAIETSVLNLFSSNNTRTTAINLLPYPDASKENSLKSYYLKLSVER